MLKKLVLSLFLIILTQATTQVTWAKIPNLSTVEYVDLDLYTGKWYELARFDQKFQKGCTATTAEYSLRSDGDIRVINSCRLHTPQGELKQDEARAWIVDKSTNAKLKVQFFLTRIRLPFFAGNYWVLDLGEEGNSPYSHAIVGDDSGDYLWILARTPKVSEEKYNELVARAKELGFDTSKLLKTIH